MTAAMEPTVTAGGRGSPYCGAKLRQAREDGRETCTLARGFKTSHPGFGNCHLHGGATPAGVAAAERERTEQLLADARLVYGLPLDIEPADALLGLVRTAAGAVAWLGRQVAQLPAEKVTTVNGKTHPLVEQYLEERKHLASVAKTALDAGIAEREIRLQEAQGRLFVRLVEGALRQLDALAMTRLIEHLPGHEQEPMRHRMEGVRLLDPLDEEVRAVVSAQLRELGPGEAA